MITFTMSVALAGAVTTIAVVVLASVGARYEFQGSLPVQAPGPITALVRRLLGVHVSRPSGRSGITAGSGASSQHSMPAPPGWY